MRIKISKGKVVYLKFLCILSLGVAITCIGCAGHYGKWLADDETTRLFQTNSVPENWNYFFSGQSASPMTMVGIHPDYQLVGQSWTALEPNTEEFARKASNMWEPLFYFKYHEPRGAKILLDGQVVGIWYSYVQSATFKVSKKRIVTLN